MNALSRFVEAGHSWLIECIGLVLIPFVHEDVAILGGSLMVVEHRLPPSLAIVSLFAGMVSSDLLLYGLGALARFVPGLTFPVYLGCGLFGISFSRFALTTSFTAPSPYRRFCISSVGWARTPGLSRSTAPAANRSMSGTPRCRLGRCVANTSHSNGCCSRSVPGTGSTASSPPEPSPSWEGSGASTN